MLQPEAGITANLILFDVHLTDRFENPILAATLKIRNLGSIQPFAAVVTNVCKGSFVTLMAEGSGPIALRHSFRTNL